VKNLSPSADRIARVAVCIVEQGQLLMTQSEHSSSGWSLPGGGVDPGETLEHAAKREAWEEAGATVEVLEPILEYISWSGHPGYCFKARLIHLEPSPEGRDVQWVNPLDATWREDRQIKMLLEQTRVFEKLHDLAT
jgi:8-oxo-dGTP pyrophosphatase MutT (NUDIX family)